MARSQASVTKKEKEKKKLQKRKDKEQRKEDRKLTSMEGKSLEHMMAYVDENGNITNTPPDPAKKRTIATDDIVIGSRNNDSDRSSLPLTGKVTFFNTSKGYGFIKDDNTEESLFVHINSIITPIKENDKVTYETQRSPKGLTAVQVKKI